MSGSPSARRTGRRNAALIRAWRSVAARQKGEVVARTGRPKVADPRTQVVRVRLTDSELAAIERHASEQGCQVSPMIRAMIGFAMAEMPRSMYPGRGRDGDDEPVA